MFIGGLNWETTDTSLRDYFSQFGEVLECTVMRDGATGRSRGFGFLTFKDPKTVNIVMVKEHSLDGKLIDPKRAIPRDEQEKTSKIFVGGVSQDATESDFENFFGQFGRVIDATLMMDKETMRPRGFGFVTFEGEAAVEACLAQPLEILGKPVEVKRAEPRGNVRDDEPRGGKFGRRGQNNDRFNRNRDENQNRQGNEHQQGQQNGAPASNMTPQMMGQYWQRMQQYFAMMQQQMATSNMGGGQAMPSMNGMNPQMMMAMQGMNAGQSGSQSPGGQGMNGMNPAMMQQFQQAQQMQQMQQQQQQAQAQAQAQVQAQAQAQGGYPPRMMSPMDAAAAANRPGYTAKEQLAFEQRKYEQQQQRRGPGQPGGSPAPGAPSSWEGMYDDVPQPNQGGRGRGSRGSQGTPQPPAGQAPANAPTGPKNAGRPGANYRGGGRGNHRGFHPYARS